MPAEVLVVCVGVGKSGSESIIDLSKTALPSYVTKRVASVGSTFVLLSTKKN